ncbi:MAG: hypothetical protein QW177_09635 [Candidatus Nitrosotenuis sp.]
MSGKQNTAVTVNGRIPLRQANSQNRQSTKRIREWKTIRFCLIQQILTTYDCGIGKISYGRETILPHYFEADQ